MTVQCTRVSPWIFGTYLVKYDTERDPVRKPLLGSRRCPDDATCTAMSPEGFVFHWCALHATEPTCGAKMQDPETK